MAGAAWKKSHRFAIAAASVLLINLVAIAFLGRGFDDNVFLFALNLPGLPCGIGVAWDRPAFRGRGQQDDLGVRAGPGTRPGGGHWWPVTR